MSEIVTGPAHGERHQDDQAPKFSRYRSLRGKSVSTLPSTGSRMAMTMAPNNGHAHARGSGGGSSHGYEDGQQQEAASGNSIARSRSRYRRRANSVSVKTDATMKLNSDPPSQCEPPLPPVPAQPAATAAAILGSSKSAGISQKEDGDPESSIHSPPRRQLRNSDTTRRRQQPPPPLPPPAPRAMADDQSRPSTSSDEGQRRRIADRDERRRQLNEQERAVKHAEDVARMEAERDRVLAEQKKKDLQRLEAQLANSQGAAFQSHKPRSPIIEKFANLTKGRRNRDQLSPGLSPTSSANDSGESHSRTTSFEPAKVAPVGIEVGGKGIVPQTDAPNSAINGADRTVAVRCRHHTFDLEVTPETTPVDILFQTSNQMSYDLEISPSNCVVIETYGVLGLERRLRRYEHIRDVMNSWDGDTQNQLMVAVSESYEQDHELDITSVPRGDQPPPGFQLYMYHSNRPGKWNKRWITLLDNGQILCAKKPTANTADKDTASLCRLSDYDIYTPTASQMRRHLKPPKRYCFAVKSQQKTTVFVNTENYVQYFSTEDPNVATQFREQAQAWRSWYLVDRRPEAKRQPKVSIPKTDERPPQLTISNHAPKKSVNVAALGDHRLRVSVDEAPYSIGQFEPLLDMKRFDKRLSQFGKDFLPSVPDASTMPKSIPAQHRPVPKDVKSDLKLIDTIKSGVDDGFTGGLLGAGYEERKQAAAEGDRRPQRTRTSSRDAAFTDGPSLLNKPAEPETPTNPKPESPSWFPSALEHTAKARTTPTSATASGRPNTSAGVMHTRRPSMTSSSTRPPLPLTGSGSRPPTQAPHHHQHFHPTPHSHSHSHSPAHAHPNPLASQPTGISLSHNNRREKPKPLVNITAVPTVLEPPQWNREKMGHGVRAPEGMMHLVDLITVKDPSCTSSSTSSAGTLLEVPPRSALRRTPNSAPVPLSRARSKSSGAPVPSGRTLLADVPPVPSLPLSRGAGAGDGQGKGRAVSSSAREREEIRGRDTHTRDRERDREREREKREKQREYREREAAFNAVPGRTGTLKVV